jgi:hypothetical protein
MFPGGLSLSVTSSGPGELPSNLVDQIPAEFKSPAVMLCCGQPFVQQARSFFAAQLFPDSSQAAVLRQTGAFRVSTGSR